MVGLLSLIGWINEKKKELEEALSPGSWLYEVKNQDHIRIFEINAKRIIKILSGESTIKEEYINHVKDFFASIFKVSYDMGAISPANELKSLCDLLLKSRFNEFEKKSEFLNLDKTPDRTEFLDKMWMDFCAYISKILRTEIKIKVDNKALKTASNFVKKFDALSSLCERKESDIPSYYI